MVTVIQQQSLVSWDDQTRNPTVLIMKGKGAFYREIPLTYREARKLVRDLQETLDRIDEERKWL